MYNGVTTIAAIVLYRVCAFYPTNFSHPILAFIPLVGPSHTDGGLRIPNTKRVCAGVHTSDMHTRLFQRQLHEVSMS